MYLCKKETHLTARFLPNKLPMQITLMSSFSWFYYTEYDDDKQLTDKQQWPEKYDHHRTEGTDYLFVNLLLHTEYGPPYERTYQEIQAKTYDPFDSN